MSKQRINLPQITFGIELETDRGDVRRLPTGFDRKYDGSISGHEFVTPILKGRRGIERLKKFMARGEGIETGRNCGLHLHLGMAGRHRNDLVNIFAAYLFTQDKWFNLVNHHRQSNGYCRRFERPASRAYDAYHFIMGGGSFTDFAACDRYRWLNIKAYRKFRTFENRLFQGTWDFNVVARWAILNMFFVREAANSLNVFAGRRVDSLGFARRLPRFNRVSEQCFATACYKTNEVMRSLTEPKAAPEPPRTVEAGAAAPYAW